LRAILRCSGVYVKQNNKHTTIAKAFMAIIQQEEFHKWTKDEVKETNLDLISRLITLVYITPKRNLCLEMLAKVGAPQPTTP
jgi:hypothetical protein